MLSFDKVSCGGRIDFLNIFAVQGIIFLSVVLEMIPLLILVFKLGMLA